MIILLSIFAILAVNYRSCRPLLWIYNLFLFGFILFHLFLIFWSSIRLYDFQLLGQAIWNLVTDHTRYTFEEEFNCCAFLDISEYGDPKPPRCLEPIQIKISEKEYKKSCSDAFVSALEVNLQAFWVVWIVVFLLELFCFIAAFILLANRLPYRKNKKKNKELRDLDIDLNESNWQFDHDHRPILHQPRSSTQKRHQATSMNTQEKRNLDRTFHYSHAGQIGTTDFWQGYNTNLVQPGPAYRTHSNLPGLGFTPDFGTHPMAETYKNNGLVKPSQMNPSVNKNKRSKRPEVYQLDYG